MKIAVPKAVSLAVLAGVYVASVAFGGVVNFGIVSAGPDNLAGVYTDPYSGLINGTTPVPAFCDDFSDDVSPPQFWTALTTNISQLPDSPSTVYYSGVTVNGTAYSETTAYVAASILAVQSLQSGDANTRNELSFALWGIFDPTLLNNVCSTYGCMNGTQLSDAVSDRASALTTAQTYASGGAYENATGVNVVIYTPTTNNVSPSTASNRPQEFITVQMPEPSTLAVLGFDLAGIGIIGLVFRRRQSRR